MADIRCPNCGRDNPSFLDTCQFCQTPLTNDSVQIGKSPTPKQTGELEEILPQWLKDVRQQGRESAEEEELSSPAPQPRSQKNEAPDLLAGLASQTGNDEEDDIPDWLASINPVTAPKTTEIPAPAPSNDFFAQFDKRPPVEESQTDETPPDELPTWVGRTPSASVPAVEKSEWFSNAPKETEEPFVIPPASQSDDWMANLGAPASQSVPEEKEDLGWLHDLEASAKQAEAPSMPSPQGGDLGWLNNLGGDSQPVGSQPAPSEDMGWLNTLGGISEPAQPASAAPVPASDDLTWLKDLGHSEPAQPAPASSGDDLGWLKEFKQPSEPVSEPTAPKEDLSWLDQLGGTSEPASSTPASDDLSWLNNLGSSAPAQPAPASSSDDLGWLKDFEQPAESAPPAPEPQNGPDWLGSLGGTPEPAQQGDADWLKEFAASTTAESTALEASGSQDLGWLNNLGDASQPETPAPAEPAKPQGDVDWLVELGEVTAAGALSAKPFGTTDELSLPQDFDENASARVSPFVARRTAPLTGDTLGDDMPDWLKSATEEKPAMPLGADALEQFRETPRKPSEEGILPLKQDVFSSTPAEPQSLSSQDLDSLFSMDMPDWLSKSEPEAGTAVPPETPALFRDESLSPVDLPSWVQAMRPVESVLSEAGVPSIESQPTEKEGPLAGLRGVIPSAPVGSSRRPKVISLKLQATDEQQAGAELFDQILAAESAPRALPSASAVFTSQNVLRWAIAAVLFLGLGGILLLRSQFLPIYASLPADVSAASNAIAAVPNGSSVLVVLDYEPSLAGEMEAVSAPVLNQLILAHQPQLVLLSTSANSNGLIERLLSHAGITSPQGFNYTLGGQYCSVGYLPGGTAGIMRYLQAPDQFVPANCQQVFVSRFSGYSAVIVLTDHAESGRSWVEQLDVAKQLDASLAGQSVILVTSAQAGPLLQPYVSSKQAAGMINGLADAARFEYANNLPLDGRVARAYWDAFGIGILLALVLIVAGSAWNLIAGFRARRANGKPG